MGLRSSIEPRYVVGRNTEIGKWKSNNKRSPNIAKKTVYVIFDIVIFFYNLLVEYDWNVSVVTLKFVKSNNFKGKIILLAIPWSRISNCY